MKALWRSTRGGAAAETVVTAAVATLAVGALSSLGQRMAEGITGEGSGAPRAMVVSRQAAGEEAARFAAEVAEGVRRLGHAEAARLRDMGLAVWKAEQGRAPTTSTTDLVRALGADTLRSVTDSFGDRLPTYLAELEKRDRLPVDDLWREFSQQTEVQSTGGFAARVAGLSRYHAETPWLRLDLPSVGPGDHGHPEALSQAVALDADMQELIRESGLVVGFADFSKLYPAIAHQRFATQGHTLLVNVGEGIPFHLGTTMKAMDDFGVELVAGTTVPWQRAGAMSSPAVHGALERLLSARDGRTLHVWHLAKGTLGDGPTIHALPAEELTARAEHDPRFRLFAGKGVAAYLEHHGEEVAAKLLRDSGEQLRVDAVDFGQLDDVLGEEMPAAVRGLPAVTDGDGGRLYLNLADERSFWPSLLADFVERTISRNP